MTSAKTETSDFELPAARRSKCADESDRAEQARIWAMTPRERMIEALELGRWLHLFPEARTGAGKTKP